MNAGRLLELTVTDLALIDRLRLTLGPGLNVITGETGAGKSLLIDALGLVCGMRADTALSGMVPRRPASRPSSTGFPSRSSPSARCPPAAGRRRAWMISRRPHRGWTTKSVD